MTELATLADRAREYARAATAPNTVRAYESDWRHWSEWCLLNGQDPLPADPTVLALYVAELAPVLKVSTVGRRLTAIAEAHRRAGHPSPTDAAPVRQVWKGVRTTHGSAKTGKSPVLTEQVRRMVDGLPDKPIGLRDRAMLLLGYAGALRRAELVALDVPHVEFAEHGMLVTIARSKGDQEGQGAVVGVPYGSDPATCPVRALRAWLDAAGIAEGALFRHVDRHGRILSRCQPKAVAIVVKRAAGRAGIDPERVSGHSLRAGHATQAAEAGVPERAIQRQTRHKSLPTLRGYIRHGTVWTENSATRLGL